MFYTIQIGCVVIVCSVHQLKYGNYPLHELRLIEALDLQLRITITTAIR